jgi:hypothetical protein
VLTAKAILCRLSVGLVAAAMLMSADRAAGAATPYYVNGATGNDTWDGRCEVHGTGTCGPKKTIQAGIDAASAGDEVVIAPGTYTGDDNRDLDLVGKAITVRSTDPNDPVVVAGTVIDCQGTQAASHFGFIFQSGEGPATVVAGLTIVRGWYSDYGGGIYTYQSSPTITNCTISDCVIGGPAGKGHGGGGIFCYGGAPTITGCTIQRCSAVDYGGGVFTYQSNATIADCAITGNSVTQSGGGGVFCYLGVPRIERCDITGNTAANWGGAVFSWASSTIMSRCNIRGNSASSFGGGVLCFTGSDPSITDCTIVGNSSDQGGGLCTYDSNPGVFNCTIAGNTATSLGGGVYCESGLTIANCILWGDTAPAGPEIAVRTTGTYPARLFVRYADVQGGQPQVDIDAGSVLDWGSGNMDAGPLFVDPDGPDDVASTWQDNDYHLQPGSPCVDAGRNADVPANVTTDMDGADRIADGNNDKAVMVDLGAYELRWLPAGDTDRDGDVDLADFLTFQGCFNGPNRSPANEGCGKLDFDRDTDVDLADFLTFQACFNGPNRPAACLTGSPSISCPLAVEADSTGDLTLVSLGTATATDTQGTTLTTVNDAPVDGFSVGIALVTWSAVDAYGQAAWCRQSVGIRGPMITTSTGLQYQELVVGTGPTPAPYANVRVKYIGTLTDGTQFDASDSAVFSLAQVIPGFAEGIRSMEVGGKRRLVIPPELGYGSAGAPPTIPPNATLIFVVDLLGLP